MDFPNAKPRPFGTSAKENKTTHHCRFFWWSCRFDGFYLGYLTASLPDAAWPCPWGTTKAAAQPATWWTSWVGAVTKLQMVLSGMDPQIG